MKPLTQYPTILLSPAWSLHLGMARDGESRSFVLVGRRGGEWRVLWCGTQLPRFLTWVPPVAMHADIGVVPVTLLSDELRGEEPETWVDRNEERIVPVGLGSDRAVSEWGVHDRYVFAATMNREAHEETCRGLAGGGSMVLSSLSVPLWDIARLYWQRIAKPFVLFAVGSTGTVLGYVADGWLRRVVTFWAGREELAANAEDLGPQIAGLCKSLARGETDRVVAVPASNGECLPEGIAIPGFELSHAPSIAGLAPECHEAFALAMHEDTHLDFAPFEQSHTARRIASSRHTALRVARVVAAVVGTLAAALVLTAGGLAVAHAIVGSKVEPIRADIARLGKATAQRDSLAEAFSRKARFMGRESMSVALMSDLQSVFPEGIWAEEIALSEKASGLWDLTITAMAYSTTTIADMMKRLGGVEGVDGVRMLYSEQTTYGKGRNAKKVVRFKVSGEWGR